MLTPQEVSEHAFAKAGFGGYNMAMVDEFLDQLTEDYTTLYKEYRSTEDAMRKTLLTAQKMADDMVKEAEEKRASLVSHAEEEARKRVSGLRQEVEAEQLRLTAAQNATAAYVAKLKELYQHELDYMNSLSQLTPSAPKAPDPVVTAVQDIEASVQRIGEEEQEDLEDTKELPTEELDAEISEEKPGGLYGELTATFLDRDGETERKMKVNPERRAADRAAVSYTHLTLADE